MTNLLAQKLAVLYGGNSAERDVSLASGKAVAAGLEKAGFTDVVLIDTKDFDLHKLVDMNVTRVFIALHGRGGEDGSLQGALEFLGVPYTGSGVLGSALAMDKIKTKQILQAVSLPTASFIRSYWPSPRLRSAIKSESPSRSRTRARAPSRDSSRFRPSTRRRSTRWSATRPLSRSPSLSTR